MDYLTPQRQRELVADAHAGDNTAFGVLYEHFRAAICGHISGRLGNPEDVEDVSGDCFLLALKAVQQGRFDPQYSFYTFLRGIADNEIKRLLKRQYVQVPRFRNQGTPAYVPKVLAIPEKGSVTGAWRLVDRMLASMPRHDAQAVASELLRLVLSCTTKPHQNLAFCLIRFLEWRPREVVRDLSRFTLFQIAQRVYESFAVVFPGWKIGQDQDSRRRHCAEFWNRVEEPTAKVYPEPEYERLRTEYPGNAQDLVLEAFYGPSPTASLSDWCDKVRRRARKAAKPDMSNGR